MYTTKFGSNQYLQSISKYTPQRCWKKYDSLQLCIDYKYSKITQKMRDQGMLYFIKKNQILGKSLQYYDHSTNLSKLNPIKENKMYNGKIKLDFKNNYYMIALCSHVAGKTDDGYTFQVTRI